MRARTLAMLAAGVCLAACGGSDNTGIGGDDGGGSSSGGSSGGSSGAGSSGSGSSGSGSSSGSSSGSNDGGMDAQVACDGGLVSCGGQCVDTKNDPKNCGGCGVLCTGGTCMGGVCSLLGSGCDGGVPAVGDFACIGIDTQNVYVATGRQAATGGQVYKVPIAGGCPTTLVANQAQPHGVVSDGTNVYWTDNGSGEIWKSDTNGGNAMAIVSNQAGPLNIAVDGAGVYWTNQGNQQGTAASVWRADKNGMNAKALYSMIAAFHAGFVTVDATKVYFPDSNAGTVFAVDKTGASPAVPIAMNQSHPYGIAVDAASVYWTNQSGGQVMKLDLKPNSMPVTLAMNQSSPNGIATDGTDAFWANAVQNMMQSSGQIQKVPVGGGATTQLAGMQNFPNCVAVDSTSVYWIDEGGGMISKTAK